jgi:hypothetical protein
METFLRLQLALLADAFDELARAAADLDEVGVASDLIQGGEGALGFG